MSYGIRTISFLVLVLAFTVLLDRAVAGRDFPAGPSKNDKKQPEWLLDPDGSLLIPGVGRVMVPPKYRPYLQPYLGGGGGGGMDSPPLGGDGMSPPSGGNQIPGGDDTFIPNPGVDVPNPSSGGTPAPSGP